VEFSSYSTSSQSSSLTSVEFSSFSSSTEAIVPPLDRMTGGTILAVALSLIKTGALKCIRVRRSQDNAETDIGFVGNDLDIATLEEFVGEGNDGFVVTLYDQDGGTDPTQSTDSRQYQIVANGSTMVNANGSPRMWHDQTAGGYSWGAAHAASDYHLFYGYHPDSVIVGPMHLTDIQTGRLIVSATLGNPTSNIPGWSQAGASSGGGVALAALQAMSFRLVAANDGEIIRNGVSHLSGQPYVQRGLANARVLLAGYTYAAPFAGSVTMMVFQDTDITADQNRLLGYSQDYYGSP